jgi:hypothetical protein
MKMFLVIIRFLLIFMYSLFRIGDVPADQSYGGGHDGQPRCQMALLFQLSLDVVSCHKLLR